MSLPQNNFQLPAGWASPTNSAPLMPRVVGNTYPTEKTRPVGWGEVRTPTVVDWEAGHVGVRTSPQPTTFRQRTIEAIPSLPEEPTSFIGWTLPNYCMEPNS